jgi:hypothetical protein
MKSQVSIESIGLVRVYELKQLSKCTNKLGAFFFYGTPPLVFLPHFLFKFDAYKKSCVISHGLVCN